MSYRPLSSTALGLDATTSYVTPTGVAVTDTANVQAAINAMSGVGTVYLKAGTFVINTPITPKNNVRVVLQGKLYANIAGVTTAESLFYYTTEGKATGSTTVVATTASTLNGGITTGSSILLADGSAFPAGKFVISVENERMWCSVRSSNTLIVTRAIDGTTAASHSSGIAVSVMPKFGSNTIKLASVSGIPTDGTGWIAIFPQTIGQRGGYYRVVSVSGSTVTLDRAIEWAFNPGDLVSIYTTDPTLDGFILEGTDDTSIITGKCVAYVNLVGARNCKLINIIGRSTDAEVANDAGFAFQEGFNNTLQDCFIDGRRGSDGVTGTNCPDKGIAMVAQEGLSLIRNRVINQTHGYGFGLNDNIKSRQFVGNSADNCNYGFALGTETSATSNIEGSRALIFRDTVVSNMLADGIVLFDGASEVTIDGFSIDNCAGQGINIASFAYTTMLQRGNKILNGEVRNCTGAGILLDLLTDRTELAHLRLRFNSYGLRINTSATRTTAEDIDVSENSTSDLFIVDELMATDIRTTNGTNASPLWDFQQAENITIKGFRIEHGATSNNAAFLINNLSGRVHLSGGTMLLGHANDIAISERTGGGQIDVTHTRASLVLGVTGTIGLFADAGKIIFDATVDLDITGTPVSISSPAIAVPIQGSGFKTIATTGGTTTLLLSEAMQTPTIETTGVLGSNATIVWPAVPGLSGSHNNKNTGSFTTDNKPLGGTGLTTPIPQGKAAGFYVDSALVMRRKAGETTP